MILFFSVGTFVLEDTAPPPSFFEFTKGLLPIFLSYLKFVHFIPRSFLIECLAGPLCGLEPKVFHCLIHTFKNKLYAKNIDISASYFSFKMDLLYS